MLRVPIASLFTLQNILLSHATIILSFLVDLAIRHCQDRGAAQLTVDLQFVDIGNDHHKDK